MIETREWWLPGRLVTAAGPATVSDEDGPHRDGRILEKRREVARSPLLRCSGASYPLLRVFRGVAGGGGLFGLGNPDDPEFLGF